MASRDSNPPFITNKWLIGTLVALVISMGGYIFQGVDRTSSTHLSLIEAAEKRINALERGQDAADAERNAQYTEIIRRLDRLEGMIYKSPFH